MWGRPVPASTSSAALVVVLAVALAACSPGPAAPGPHDNFLPAQTLPAPRVPHPPSPVQAIGATDTRLSCSLVPGTGRSADPWVLMPVSGRCFDVTGCKRDGATTWFVILVQGETILRSTTVKAAVRLVHAVVDGPDMERFVDSTGRGVDSAVWGNALVAGRAVPLHSLGNPAAGVRFGVETTAGDFGVEVDLRR